MAAGARKRGGKDYLLSPMGKRDLAVLDEVLDRVATATRRIIQDGAGPAMNEFNRKEAGTGRDRRDQGTKDRLGTDELLWCGGYRLTAASEKE